MVHDGALLDGTGSIRPDRVDDAVRDERNRKAARVLAGTHARDAADCALLLDMLGLTPQDGLTTKGATS
jgi:hypothetical protein